ncbi:putative Fe-containing alcohol dehydrogenase [Ascobolus immersus RN42]|uniref:hydroxyacid-oxoacid transhydrogenase n=1 Tax=Ascobolus immersus RN42 TaxID=1160509 RepID=A0A3N4IED1_ASCIM|nr:putative Fe-containing alcohol dehydrogenase [Ascobolus immersus RN42]
MSIARVLPSLRTRAASLLNTIQFTHPPNCPCHGVPNHPHHKQHNEMASLLGGVAGKFGGRRFASPAGLHTGEREYAFEMAASSIRFGPGCTREVGMDLANLGAQNVLVLTDPNIAELPPMLTAIEALEASNINYTIFKDVHVEPKDTSVKAAIAFAKNSPKPFDAFLAVGGGSVMDTAKIVNLYTTYPDADFLDFVNAPLGKGLPITKKLAPLICIPTTSGTGSETTGTAIFDLTTAKAKTGIAHRALKPTLGICDPLNTRTMPPQVHASSGLDVLFHALESYTAIPYNTRTPRPANPVLRPAYQGANPISDVFSLQALKMTVKYLPRAVRDPDDYEAQEKMLLGATLAGVGFGNAGVHLCHGMSYPISGNNKSYRHADYSVPNPLIPHGVSVAVTAPAVFAFTAASNPDRHREAAEIFGIDTTNVPDEAVGEKLGEGIKKFLGELGGQPMGLKGLGYTRGDVERLVEGTLPQRRVLMLAPGMKEPGTEREREDLAGLLERSLEY